MVRICFLSDYDLLVDPLSTLLSSDLRAYDPVVAYHLFYRAALAPIIVEVAFSSSSKFK